MDRLSTLIVCVALATLGCESEGSGGGAAPSRSRSESVQAATPVKADPKDFCETWHEEGSAPALALPPLTGPAPASGGKSRWINVWATWCKPCMRELPELATLHREHAPQGFTVLGVSVDKRQMLGKVRSMVTSYQLEYPMLFDPESQAIGPWQIAGYPTSVLVGRDGTIRWRRDGMIHPDDPELEKQLEAALAQPAS